MNPSITGSIVIISMSVSAALAADRFSPVPVSLASPVQIPGAVLQAGAYTIQLEDRMYDRAIVKISESGGKQYILLTVPDTRVPAGSSQSHLVLATGTSGQQYAQGWVCPSCKSVLEFAYPKAEAVELAKATVNPVLAVDPESDKLPPLPSLTKADLKVVNLWMLTPSRVSPDAEVQIAAAHFQSQPEQSPVVADNTAPTAAPMPAPAAERTRRLPATASNDFNFGALGILSLAAAFTIRRFRTASAKG